MLQLDTNLGVASASFNDKIAHCRRGSISAHACTGDMLTDDFLESGGGFWFYFKPCTLSHPEDEEMALEWVIFCNGNLFFIIHFHKLELEKSALVVAVDMWVEYL